MHGSSAKARVAPAVAIAIITRDRICLRCILESPEIR
jgi:hypothetical protein